MRKNAKYLLVTLLSFCFAVNVHAAECSYEEQVKIGNEASTVKVTYEATDIDTGEVYYSETEVDADGNPAAVKQYEKGFNVKILNVTEDIYLEVTNSLGDRQRVEYNQTKNGMIDLGVKRANKIVTYSVKVFIAKGGCAGKELRTIEVLIPRYNSYSESMFCKDNPDFEYCQEYLTSSTEIDFLTFDTEAKKYQEKKEEKAKEENKTFTQKIKDFIKENKKIIIICLTIIIIMGAAIIAIIVIRKRRRLI